MKLSPRSLSALRAIDAGNEPPTRRTVISLWRHGLIEERIPGEQAGWKLTPLGRISLDKGRVMVSGRRP